LKRIVPAITLLCLATTAHAGTTAKTYIASPDIVRSAYVAGFMDGVLGVAMRCPPELVYGAVRAQTDAVLAKSVEKDRTALDDDVAWAILGALHDIGCVATDAYRAHLNR
jgi:hypothetical protein